MGTRVTGWIGQTARLRMPGFVGANLNRFVWKCATQVLQMPLQEECSGLQHGLVQIPALLEEDHCQIPRA